MTEVVATEVAVVVVTEEVVTEEVVTEEVVTAVVGRGRTLAVRLQCRLERWAAAVFCSNMPVII